MGRFMVASRAQLQVSKLDLHRHAEFVCGWNKFVADMATFLKLR